MTLNCRPGELAYITTPGPFLGRVVRVLRLDGFEGPPAWEYEGHIPCDMNRDRYSSLWDEILRPLRDPGNARDETLDWAPVPTTKELA